MTPRVAVIVPAYNVAAYVVTALLTVESQVMSDWECIIVDDGSTDDTVDCALRYTTQCDRQFFTEPRGHCGLAASVNYGVSTACAPLVMSMGADDIMDPLYLRRCCDALDANPVAPCAYGRVKEFGTRTEYWIPGGYVPGQLATRNVIPGCALWRREVWDQLGGFDVRFDQGLEDWHMAARAEVAGILSRETPPLFVPEVTYLHRARADSLTDTMTPEYRAWAEREIGALFDMPTAVAP